MVIPSDNKSDEGGLEQRRDLVDIRPSGLLDICVYIVARGRYVGSDLSTPVKSRLLGVLKISYV